MEEIDVKEFISLKKFYSDNVFHLVFRDSLGRRHSMFLTSVISDSLEAEVNTKIREKMRGTMEEVRKEISGD